MLPLSDRLKARKFPLVNVLLIVANFAVWIFYELPHVNEAVYHASFYPCTVTFPSPEAPVAGDDVRLYDGAPTTPTGAGSPQQR